MKKTIHNAIDTFKKEVEEETIDVALLFYVDKGGKKVKLKQIGNAYETVVALNYLKDKFIDDVIKEIIENQQKLMAERENSVN